MIDDEPLALDFLERQIKEISDLEIVEKFIHFDIKKHGDILHHINVVFLDIEMPEINGLELAEQLLEVNPLLSIVFVTAFNEYAVNAFELNALDYLLKPVEKKRLKKTLERIEKHTKTADDRRPIPAESLLHINLCHELTFKTSNDKIEIVKWRTKKAKELFIYLLFNVGRTVQKSELAELLWPDFKPERAYSQLYTAVYNIRKNLINYDDHLSIKSVHEGYTLLTENTVIDIIEWENKLSSLSSINANTVAEYENTMSLYTGSFLETYEYLWAEPERYRLKLLWLETATQIADFYKQNNNIEKAISWYSRICEHRPESEHANLSIMKLYASLGYGLLVDHQYEQFKNALDELGIPLGFRIQSWYNNWKDKASIR